MNDEMWIMQFQNTVLICHIVIFLEFGVVHYAARQIQRQRAKHKDDAEFFMSPSGQMIEGSVRASSSESRSGDATLEGQPMSNDGGAARRSSRPAGSTTGSDVRGFSIQEDTVIGMPSVANMLTETLNRPDDDSTCLDSVIDRCRRTTNEEEQELSEVFGSTLAAKGALRAHTWHRWSGLIDWLARFTFPPVFGCYYAWKMASVDALCVLPHVYVVHRCVPLDCLACQQLDVACEPVHVSHLYSDAPLCRWLSLGLVEVEGIVAKSVLGCTVLVGLCACPGCVDGCRSGCRDVRRQLTGRE